VSSDSIHDAALCAEKRGRTPARSIDAALSVGSYTGNCDYLMINAVSLNNYLSLREVCRCWQTLFANRHSEPQCLLTLCRFQTQLEAKVAKWFETRLLLLSRLYVDHSPCPCLRQLPSCVAVYPRDARPRRVLCCSSHSLHSAFCSRHGCLYSLLSMHGGRVAKR